MCALQVDTYKMYTDILKIVLITINTFHGTLIILLLWICTQIPLTPTFDPERMGIMGHEMGIVQ